MKRTILYAMALVCAMGVQAQSSKDLERVGFMRDSVAEVLAEHRMSYAKNEAVREKLTPTILSLEKEVVRLQREYDKIVEVLLQSDAKSGLMAYEQAVKDDKKRSNAI